MQQMVYTIRLDLRDTGIVNTSLRLKQGDSGIKIVVNVFNGGVAVFDSSTTPKIVFRRPDGAAVMADMTVESSSYSYTLVGNELQVPGKELIDVKFPLGDTGRESTLSCSIEVVPDTITPNTHGSDIYDNDLAELVAEATAAAETVEEVVGDSEAWAVGERNGVPVGPEDPAYHNNSKWWSEQANVTSLAALTDVDLDALEDGDLLQFDSTSGKWKNSADVRNGWKKNGAYNLLPMELYAPTTSSHNITWTVNADGSISTSNTTKDSTNESFVLFSRTLGYTVPAGQYIFCGKPSASKYRMQLQCTRGGVITTLADLDYGTTSAVVTIQEGDALQVALIVKSGETGGDTFYPMLTTDLSATNADFTPPAKTNRQLTESQVKRSRITLTSSNITAGNGKTFYVSQNSLPSDFHKMLTIIPISVGPSGWGTAVPAIVTTVTPSEMSIYVRAYVTGDFAPIVDILYT